jgi:methylenetetrahydrofolate reductase (NADPH)
MKIADMLKRSRPVFSFEFFPPKTDRDMIQLFETLRDARKLDPGYISVTYAPGGETREKTVEIVRRAKSEIGLESMAHLTCVGQSRQEIKGFLDALKRSEIENVIALRGDPPRGQTQFVPHPEGFRYASELTAFIRASYDFCIGVAGYPEGHIESPDKEMDWDYLRQKVMAGADFVITQLFFDNRDFFAFEKSMRERGVTVPIVPGIMPITNYGQIVRFTRICGAKIPSRVAMDLEAIHENQEAVQDYGISHATRQCRELLSHGVPGIHFYTLNKSRSTQKIIRNLGHNS